MTISVQVRDCRTAQEVLANAREVAARRRRSLNPPPKPVIKIDIVESEPEPEPLPVVVVAPPEPKPEPEPDVPATPGIWEIIKAVCEHYQTTKIDFLSQRRHAKLVRARQVAGYLARHLTLASFPEIGRLVQRDHTTVIHGAQKITQLRLTDQVLNAEVAALTDRILQHPRLSLISTQTQKGELSSGMGIPMKGEGAGT